MTYEAVDVYVVENTPSKPPVAGVMVRVYDSTNRQFFTQDVTDENGRVGFTLWSQGYSLRFFKNGVQVKQPQVIEVIAPNPGGVLVNAFEVKAVVFHHPIATDARLCRASGFFRDITGAPDKFVDLFFQPKFDPILLEDAAVLSERIHTRSDEEGFACIDLIRFARYSVTVQGYEGKERTIEVPDQPSVNLPDILFPVVELISFTPEISSMLVGESVTITPVVLGSNDVPLIGTATGDVVWSSSDDTILSVAVSSETITLTGRGVGTAQLLASRLDNSIIRIPNIPIMGVPVTITVS